MLYFVAADEWRCRANENDCRLAAPGSRVVYVCAERFAERFAPKIEAPSS
jgi:hypothetical protein